MQIESASLCVFSLFVLARPIEPSTRLAYKSASCQIHVPDLQHTSVAGKVTVLIWARMPLENCAATPKCFYTTTIVPSEALLLSAFHSPLPPVPDHQRYACQRYSTDPIYPEFTRHGPPCAIVVGSVVEKAHAEDRLPSVS